MEKLVAQCKRKGLDVEPSCVNKIVGGVHSAHRPQRTQVSVTVLEAEEMSGLCERQDCMRGKGIVASPTALSESVPKIIGRDSHRIDPELVEQYLERQTLAAIV
jgi:hypothetical protein